jgi:hypothetical protein
LGNGRLFGGHCFLCGPEPPSFCFIVTELLFLSARAGSQSEIVAAGWFVGGVISINARPRRA